METAMQSIKDTYQRITDTIVEQLEAGTKPWIRPWRGSVRHSRIPRRATGEAYRGINVLMLWVSGQMFGYEENTWMTYRQAQDLGGQALKGEEGTLVIKYGTFTAKEHEDDEDRSKYQNELRVEPNRSICSPAWPKSTARH
jgi:antirestriction protein ArdC